MTHLKLTVTFYRLYRSIYKLATLVVGNPEPPFSIATTLRCRGGRYFLPRIAPLYPWSPHYSAEWWASRHQVPFFDSLVGLDLGLSRKIEREFNWLIMWRYFDKLQTRPTYINVNSNYHGSITNQTANVVNLRINRLSSNKKYSKKIVSKVKRVTQRLPFQ